MRAHRNAYAAIGQTCLGRIFGFFAGTARYPCHFYAHGFKPLAEFLQMLLCQNFRGSHHGYLRPSLNRIEGSQSRDYGFATAHIALQQAVHRVGLQHVLFNFCQYFLLRRSQLKR